MKLLTTILCTLAFAVAGFSLAVAEKNNASVAKHQTLMAATLPNYDNVISKLPLDVQLDLNKKTEPEKEYVPYEFIIIKDTTSKAPKVINPVHKKKRTSARATAKRQGLSTPAIVPDSAVKNKVCGDREEYTPDTIVPPKGSICLIVDGEVVYKR